MEANKYAPILHTGYANTYTEEVVEQFVQWCKNQGFSGFSMEGKSYPLTDDIDGWINTFIPCVKMGVKGASKYGLQAWLFDEWGYPTGTAAGKTLEGHLEYRSKTLHKPIDLILEAGQKIEIPTPEHFLAAAAWPTGRFIMSQPWEGTNHIYPKDGKIIYEAKSANERFVVVTWEYISSHSNGVFRRDNDKPEYGTLDLLSYKAVARFIGQMHERYVAPLEGYFSNGLNGFFYDEPFLAYPYPYTFDLFEEFKEKKGYDIVPYLPTMLCTVGSLQARSKQIRDYRDICTKRMADAFIGQMANWCHKHGIELVGHQDLDHSARGLNTNSGDFFRNSARSDAPGIDYIWNQINCNDFSDYPRFAGSARRIYGKKHAISESFAATGRALYPDQMRWTMEHQILRGIDRLFLMIADPDPCTNEFTGPISMKHPQSITFGQSLNHRIAVTNKMINEAKPAAHVAIFIPMSDIYCENLMLGHPSTTSLQPFTWTRIDNIAKALCYAPMDYDYLWEDAVLSLPLENGALVTALGQHIDTIILPGCVSLDDKICDKLREMLSQGGRVISFGRQLKELLGETELYGNEEDLVDAISTRINAVNYNSRISCAHSLADKRELFFFLNEADRLGKLDIDFGEKGHLSQYDFEKECWFSCGKNQISISFKPKELQIFSITDAIETEKEQTDGNKVTLENWSMQFTDGKVIPLSNGLVDWRNYIDPCYVGWVTYKTTLNIDSDSEICLDLGKVLYAAKVRIEGKEYLAPFSPFKISMKLTAGNHILEVDVLNTDANKSIGTKERELREGEDAHSSMFEHDRFCLASGLLGPVTYEKIVQNS